MGSSLRSVVLAVALTASPACGDQVVGSFDASTGGRDSSSSGGPTTLADETTNTGPEPSPEQCNGIDDDLDGLVDEQGPDLGWCDGCVLKQELGQAWWVCEAELPWAEAQADCEARGATLAIVATADAQAFLHTEVGEGWFWLGARQAASEGTWSWVDGTPFDYANWGDTQPDDEAPGQDCLRLTFGIEGSGWFDGAWDDYFCDDVHRVMCSAPHVPH